MKIKYLAHSCFLLTSDTGVRVLTDPFNEEVGYDLPVLEADIVTTSHSHFDHGYIQAVKGSFLHLSEPGSYTEKGISVTGVEAFHDEVKGKKRGKNIIFLFEMDGLRICHCGDLGHILSAEQAEELGNIDIMMLPVGGTFTVDAEEAYKIVKLLMPSIVIPMHYKTPSLRFQLGGVDKFLEAAGIAGQLEVFMHTREIELTRSNLQMLPGILVLDYK